MHPRSGAGRGLRTHRRPAVQRADITVQFGMRVTTPALTIADIAPRLSDRELTRIIQNARLAGRLKLTALNDLFDRCPRARRLHRS